MSVVGKQDEMKKLQQLGVGDEVTIWKVRTGFYDFSPIIYKITKVTEKMAKASFGGNEISFRRDDGRVVGKTYTKVVPVDDEIRRLVELADKRSALRDIAYKIDRLDVLQRNTDPDFVDRLYAALMPFSEEVDKFVELSKKRRY